MVHEQMSRFFQGFRRDAHPMAVMTGSIGALSAFYHDSTDIADPTQRMIASLRMIAKVPTLAAMAYKYSVGQPFVYPKNDLDYASNFLRTDIVVMGIIVIGVVAYGFDLLMRAVERRLVPWKGKM